MTSSHRVTKGPQFFVIHCFSKFLCKGQSWWSFPCQCPSVAAFWHSAVCVPHEHRPDTVSPPGEELILPRGAQHALCRTFIPSEMLPGAATADSFSSTQEHRWESHCDSQPGRENTALHSKWVSSLGIHSPHPNPGKEDPCSH